MSSAAPTPQLIGTPSTGATAPSSSSSSSSSGPSSATTTTTTSNSGATTSQQPAQTQQQLVKSYTASLLRHLQALGFDAQAVGEKHNIVFNHVMFIKPNSKGFELIVQFLLTQLDPERASRIFVPLCKEAMKEFKDAIFNWLNELATTSSGGSVGSQMSSGVSGKSVGGGGGGGGGGAGQSQTAMPLWSNPTHMRLFHLIRFPTVTRSLLTVPCGLKACEVLYALLTHVALAKAIRLINANKTLMRVYPKVSPWYAPPSSSGETMMMTGGGKQPLTPVPTNSQNWAAHTSRLTKQKQSIQFHMQTSTLKKRIVCNIENLNKILMRQFEIKAKFQAHMRKSLEEISNQLELNAKLSESIARKKRLLLTELGFDELVDVNQPMDSLLGKLKQSQTQLIDTENELAKTLEKTSGNQSLKKSIDQVIDSYESRTDELDGREMIDFLLGKSEREQKADDDDNDNDNDDEAFSSEAPNRILNSIAQNLDASRASSFDFDIDKILRDNRTKLDLVSLTRLKKLVIAQSLDAISKVNIEHLSEVLNAIFNGEASESSSVPLVTLSNDDQKFNLSSILDVKSTNEEAEKLKKKLDTIVPKFEEYLKELMSTRAAQAPTWLAESKDDYEAHEIVQELNKLDEKFYAIIDRKTFLDSAYLSEKKQKANKMSRLVDSMDAAARCLNDSNAHIDNTNVSNMMTRPNTHTDSNNLIKDGEGTLMASDGVNWLDNVSDEAMDDYCGENGEEQAAENSLGIIDLDGTDMTALF